MDEDNSGWKQIGQDIDGEAAYDWSGLAVSLSADGKTLAIGATGNAGDANGYNAGHVRVYHMADTGSNWEQLGEDIYGESAGDEAGSSVSLSADGRSVAIGSISNDDNGVNSGHVRVFNQGTMNSVGVTSTSPTTTYPSKTASKSTIYATVPSTTTNTTTSTTETSTTVS